MDAQVLIRDFVFRKGVVMWCVQQGAREIGELRFKPVMTDHYVHNFEIRRFYGPRSLATPLAESDRVWVCERALRTRCMGTVEFVLNHRKNANVVEDAKEKKPEYDEFEYWLLSRR